MITRKWTSGVYRRTLFTGYVRDFVGIYKMPTIGYPAQGSYGYNESGMQDSGAAGRDGLILGLGTSAFSGTVVVGESMVAAPAEMISIGDPEERTLLHYRVELYHAWTRHKCSHNTAFCDGHRRKKMVRDFTQFRTD